MASIRNGFEINCDALGATVDACKDQPGVRLRRDHKHVRPSGTAQVALGSIQAISALEWNCSGVDLRRVESAGPFLPREREHELAACKRRQQLLLQHFV